MQTKFNVHFRRLKTIFNLFDDVSNKSKQEILENLEKCSLPGNKILQDYADILLFFSAYPFDKKMFLIVENELKRISVYLRKLPGKNKYINSGLPNTTYVSHFSHDFVNWLLTHPDCFVEIDSFEETASGLNNILKITLPSLEKSNTTAGYNDEELLESLLVNKKEKLNFIIKEFSKLDHSPFVKDQLYEELGMYIKITAKSNHFSKLFNRIHCPSVYFHKSLIKKFDHVTLLDTKLPAASKLASVHKAHLVKVIKNAMAITDRETDPATYLDHKSLRLYELERGISIAIYGMIPTRQLPLESYVGYTLFKNGYPTAYGGGWVFGSRSNFGINIFEWFRGGESGYIMCQLLRVYRQVFNVSYFEVEPYQYGLDNPDGIKSGAFWYYYKYGFRPIDKSLLKIANNEYKLIIAKKGYRTSESVLESFTESNIALNLGHTIPPTVYSITSKVTRMIKRDYKGDRLLAVKECVNLFIRQTKIKALLNNNQQQVLEEVALWSAAFNIKDSRKLNLLSNMIYIKPEDVYQYQQLLLQFFNE
jgi:hypothetical protein